EKTLSQSDLRRGGLLILGSAICSPRGSTPSHLLGLRIASCKKCYSAQQKKSLLLENRRRDGRECPGSGGSFEITCPARWRPLTVFRATSQFGDETSDFRVR